MKLFSRGIGLKICWHNKSPGVPIQLFRKLPGSWHKAPCQGSYSHGRMSRRGAGVRASLRLVDLTDRCESSSISLDALMCETQNHLHCMTIGQKPDRFGCDSGLNILWDWWRLVKTPELKDGTNSFLLGPRSSSCKHFQNHTT